MPSQLKIDVLINGPKRVSEVKLKVTLVFQQFIYLMRDFVSPREHWGLKRTDNILCRDGYPFAEVGEGTMTL